MRVAPRTVLGSYRRDDSRGRWLIVLALQATMDSDMLKVSKKRCLLLGGRYDAQEPHPVGTGQASPPRKWASIDPLHREVKLYVSLRLP